MHASFVLAGAGFEAARRLPGQNHLHGHSFRVQARCDSQNHSQSALQTALRQAVSSFDYAEINQTLADADDLSLARHIRAALPAPASLLLRAAPHSGVLLDNGQAFSWINVQFEAAHQLPNVPPGHKCGRLHGHGFGVRLVADARHAGRTELEAAWAPLYQRLHHRYLNDIEGLSNPTSEVLALWLHQQLDKTLPGLAWVEVRETHSAGSQFDGQRFRIWKEQRFESAMPLDDAGNYSGHSYLVRLMLTGSLDRTMGWVLDFGDVKDRFKPIYRQLDHNPLDKLAGLYRNDSTAVAEWVHARLSPLVPELARIDLMEHDDSGVSLMFHHDMRWPMP